MLSGEVGVASPACEDDRMTTRTIVVGVDVSPESLLALDWAQAAAGPDDTIRVVHAWQPPLVIGYHTVLPVDVHDVGETAKAGLDELVSGRADPRLVPVVAEGHAGRSLISELDEHDGDLVVVGHRGSGLAAELLGSTANYVLHHTKKPVAVVRGERAGAPRRVVVGVDDHDMEEGDDNASVRALQWAYGLPGVERIDVIHAWFVPSFVAAWFSSPGADFEEMDRAAQEVVDRVLAAAGPTPDGVEVVGAPANGTAEFALIEASRDVDLVVLGSRGRGGWTGRLLGSTSLQVASNSHSPVAVIR